MYNLESFGIGKGGEMNEDDYTTLRRIMLLGALAFAFGSLSTFVKLEWWPFLTFLVEGGILYFIVRVRTKL